MKQLICIALVLSVAVADAQNLQIHYDFRHSIDPERNPTNFPGFSFEYFKQIDTLGSGSFLLKIQADLHGNKNNVGQVFTQLSQSIRFWKPRIYLSFNYSGGLGVTPSSYGFYLVNSFGAGIAYPFQWKGAWLSASVLYRYNAFDKPSYDPQLTFYFGKGFFNYTIFTAGSFVFWTQNKNQGTVFTQNLRGKKLAFFGDPQIWFKIKNGVSMGSRVNVFYHILSEDRRIQCYPTVGLKYQF